MVLLMLFKLGGIVSLCLLVAGFVRPVYVLWFLPKCNRRLVLYGYGSAAVFFWVGYLLVSYLLNIA
jgi:hypothetical protein